MNKFFFLYMNILMITIARGQYQAFPKLEALYNIGNYDKCLEKAESDIKNNPGEIAPNVWQMRCYLAIADLDKHTLKKNALSKALTTALRIKKKDKDGRLTVELKKDFEAIITKNIVLVSGYEEAQYATGIGIFDKLAILDNSLNLEYEKYLFMKTNNDANAFMVLKNLVVKHYSQFRKKQQPLENLESAYASLMDEYFEHAHPRYAKDVYLKASEVYKNCKECKETYMQHLQNIRGYLGYYSNEASLAGFMAELKSADSIFNDPVITSTINQLKKYIAIDNIRNLPEKNKKTSTSIMDYLSGFSPWQYDSANIFFNDLLADNITETLKIRPGKLYDFWINIKLEIKKQSQMIEGITSIHQYYIKLKKYDLDIEFLSYCETTYPALKKLILPLRAELEKLILAQISKPDNNVDPDVVDKYADKTNNKEIKDKQYSIYFTKLSGLLAAGNLSGFAVNIRKALAQYPDDPQFLSLKKQWVIKDYKTNYANTEYGYEQFFTKLPNESKCDPGIVNKKGQDIVLQKINYCRRLAGSPDSCLLDETLNLKCQKAALMMSANSSLSHSPPKTWKCYTIEGAGAAGAGNLSLGNAFHDAIMGQMEDDGSGNYAAGHRRWILNPSNTVFGHGSSMNASCLYAFGTSNAKLKRTLYFNEKQPVCWPSTDYFPKGLIPERWSFSLGGVNFDKAKVAVTESGKPVTVTIEPVTTGYGANTLVWILKGNIIVNKTYTVTISNIIPYAWGESSDNKPKPLSYTYHVIPIEID